MNAGFIFRDKISQEIIAVMALHMDNVLLAMDYGQFPDECKKLEEDLKSSVEWGVWQACMDGRVKFCGRSYKQLPDFTVEVDDDDCINYMTPCRLSREKLRQRNRALTADELRAFCGILGQPQWYARIAGYDLQFAIRQLAGQLKGPTIGDSAEAAKLSRTIQQEHQGRKMIFVLVLTSRMVKPQWWQSMMRASQILRGTNLRKDTGLRFQTRRC